MTERVAAISPRAAPSRRTVGLLFALIVAGGVAAASPYAFLTTLLDLPWAVAALAPGVALGVIILPRLRLRVSCSWHILLSLALGLGLWCNIILALGLLGWLQRWVFLSLVVAAISFLVLRGKAFWTRDNAPTPGPQADTGSEGRWRWLWLAGAPFLALGLLAAVNAPGFLWREEGFGYDVLEYHLQLPREYVDEGRITYRPHNAYANFPANIEMLYLAAMVLTGRPQDTGTICHLIHLLLGVMTVAAAWRGGRETSPRAGMVAGVAVATAGWLPYLSGLAYVELGVLLFGMMAVACVIKSPKVEKSKSRNHEDEGTNVESCPEEGSGLKWTAFAGLFAGFACGCKYTAVPMIAAPLVLAVLTCRRGALRNRLFAGVVFTLAAAAAFSPWLIKNTLMTGNPVFPLAQSVFDASPPGWGVEETAKWDRGHTPKAEEATLTSRFHALWRHIPADHLQRFGPGILALAFFAVCLALRPGLRSRFPVVPLVCLLILVVQLAVWLFASHLYARFAVVLLIPLSLLAGHAVDVGSSRLRAGAVLMLLAGSAWNLYFAARLYARESPGGAPAELFYTGELPGYEYLKSINDELPANAHILLVGDARPFYILRPVDYAVVFNRQPFVEAIEAATDPGAIADWLRERRYTHLVVHWMEVARLRRTYGFSEAVTEELFERLAPHGVRVLREFSLEGAPDPYVTLYEVVTTDDRP